LDIPPLRPDAAFRSDRVERLDSDLCQGPSLARKLTLISAPAVFGKTTLVSEWIAGCERPAAWLSLDEEDSDPTPFSDASDRRIAGGCATGWRSGSGCAPIPTAPTAPEALLTTLVNALITIPDNLGVVP
jgi:LuxR family maltose regulon positive regulatory protein